MSKELDDLICAISEALNMYDDEEDKKAVEICEKMYELGQELEKHEESQQPHDY